MRSDEWLTQLDGRLRRQLEFLIEIDRLKTIVRGTRLADESRRENTAEHSWHLAMFAMTLAEHAADTVSVERVVRMLLLHDIVEIDAGDTPVFGGTPATDQAEREQRAADRLFGLLPDDQADEFRRLWDEFEAAQTDDARFAKALDRLQPSLLNHVVGGGTWTDYDVDEPTERAATGRITHAAPALGDAIDAVIADAVAQGWLRSAT
ncbi:MAG: hydrolase [Acidimicrobiaceae bacterium]|nr:hydrolase [Acidimicrobiaceae bacterium]